MKILSDFDGVLTDQTREGFRVRALFEQELARLAKSKEAALGLIQEAVQTLIQKPSQNGWRSQGRITAFANEDLFIHCNGLAACLDDMALAKHPAASEMVQILKREGVGSFADISQSSYLQMVRETQQGLEHPIDVESKAFFDQAVALGAQIVVVSNSGTQRILDLLKNAGIEAYDHLTHPQAQVRVRGNAKKFELGVERQGFSVGEYFVDSHRPVYEQILKEEKPQVVIGDVFTLDLALPYRLMTSGTGFLRVRDYTPEWSKAFCNQESGGHPRLKCVSKLSDVLTNL